MIIGGVIIAYELPNLEFEKVWLKGLTLAILASLSLVYKVEGTTSTTHYNFSFLAYSFTIFYLGLPWALVVMLVSNGVDWFKHRYPWYIQCFNIAAYAVVFYATSAVFNAIDPAGLDFNLATGLGILAGVATYVFVNHISIGLVIWFARGENFSQSGIFDFLPVMIDFTLLGLGGVSALLWSTVPLAIPLLLAPLYLIQHTLRVPALERGVVQDPKTKLFNSEYLMSAIDKELERAERFDRPMTIVIGDMDLLRNVNNNYGHVAGDLVLLTVANILSENVRESDIVARYGGEEFVILMPESTAEEAYSRVEEIRERIASTAVDISSSVTPIHVTMSFGIAQREKHGQTKEEIIHDADLALYHSKLKGRNRTFVRWEAYQRIENPFTSWFTDGDVDA
jgi:diguanylate cyclase (GGDEF)-like protein